MFADPEKLRRFKERERETKKKNNSYAKSKIEDKCYLDLVQMFNHVERQYVTQEYPFRCDFYVGCIDTFIEINGYWTHGKHPFNPQDENDLALVEKWKSKNTPQYNAAIKNWTIIDVNKRNIAKKNGLKYKEFWTYE